MRRRTLIAGIGGVVTTMPWTWFARAQRSVPKVGFMSSRGADDSMHLVAAFREGMSANGFIEGQNVVIEYRWAKGQYDRLPALAAELASDHLSVLVTTGANRRCWLPNKRRRPLRLYLLPAETPSKVAWCKA